MKTKEVSGIHDVFLLFLPNFLLDTPLHNLIIHAQYGLFSRLAESVKIYFEEFLNNDGYINKITDMLVFILENVNSYSRSDLDESYCELPFCVADLGISDDLDEEDFNKSLSEPNKILIANIQMIQIYLSEVRKKVEEKKRFINRDDFYYVPEKI